MTKPYFSQIPDIAYVDRTKGEKTISSFKNVKNLFKRAHLRQDIFEDLTYFTKYKVIGDERPDNVAEKFYQDSTLDWVILLANNITNIQTEWPMSEQSYHNFLVDKYGIEDEEVVLSRSLFDYIVYNLDDDNKTNPCKILSTYKTTPVSVKQRHLQGSNVLVKCGTEEKLNEVHHYECSGVKNSIGTIIVEDGLHVPVGFAVTYFDAALGNSVNATNITTPVTNLEYENEIQDAKRNIYVLKQEYLSVIFNDLEDIMEYKKGSTQYVNETLKVAENIRLYST